MTKLSFRPGIAGLLVILVTAAYAETKPEVDQKPKYASYKEMIKTERPEIDFKIVYRSASRAFLVAAPHGGAIEPGSTELADAIAGESFGYYSFTALKKDSSSLYIPSTRFDEPEMKSFGKKYTSLVAVHVIDGKDKVVFVSGNNKPIADAVTASLVKLGYEAKAPAPTQTTGFGLNNFVNKSGVGGVQIEVSSALLDGMFRGPVSNARVREDPSRRTAEFGRFVQGIRVVLQQAAGNIGGVTVKPKVEDKPTVSPSQPNTPPEAPQPRQWPRRGGGRRGGGGGGGNSSAPPQ